jgi:hypothetical protein
MKLTKSHLKQIIQEELALVLEKGFGQGTVPSGEFYKKQEIVLEEDDDWIQGAEEGIERRGTEGVCTGKKFGGPTCRPGTKHYNLAKTFRKMAKDRKKKSIKEELVRLKGKCRFPRITKEWKVGGYIHTLWPRKQRNGQAASVWQISLPPATTFEATTKTLIKAMREANCAFPVGTIIKRLYLVDSGALAQACGFKVRKHHLSYPYPRTCGKWRDVTDRFQVEEDVYTEESEEKDIEREEERSPFQDDPSPIGCGPRPPLGSGWPERPVDDPVRKKFRKWYKCKHPAGKRPKK